MREVNGGEWPLLPGERPVRFGCGALAGLAAGFWIISDRTGSVGLTVVVCLGTAVLVGFAAALFGDRFWRWFFDVQGWFR